MRIVKKWSHVPDCSKALLNAPHLVHLDLLALLCVGPFNRADGGGREKATGLQFMRFLLMASD